jgi:tRNA pseudouridine13 synthase
MRDTEAPPTGPVASGLSHRLSWRIPYLTEDLPGIGGIIRDETEDFVVDEVPAYEPCGDGEHTYFRVEKRDITTLQLAKQIAEKLDLPPRSISYAGLKDARAVARQTFSVQFVPTETIEALELDRARILWVSRHRNKLRVGHLRGNRFTLRIRDVVSEAEPRAAAILDQLQARGVPNAYGPQRFGNRGDNHIAGYHLLHADRAALQRMGIRHLASNLRGLFISALQSALFNQIVALRIQDGTLGTVIHGDIARKEDTGGIFTVEDVTAERPRAAAWEISATGPIYGDKLMQAQGAAGEMESRVLAAAGLSLDDFRAIRERGLRRPLRYNPEGLTWKAEGGNALSLSFFAPKGSFATILLRELMKDDDVRQDVEL